MRIFITGGKGFTGQYLLQKLAEIGHETKCMDSDLANLDGLRTELKNFNPQSIVHLAGISSVLHRAANEFYQVNLIGTRNLLVTAAETCNDLTSVILASTAHIYGNKLNGALSESSEVNPGSDYAVSKYAMERMAKLWCEKLPIVVTRPFNYTGVGQPVNFVIPKIVSHFKEKRVEIELGDTKLFREFGDVRDVVNIYCKMIERPPVGEAINICTGQYYKLDEIIEICSDLTSHNLSVRVNTAFLRLGEPEKIYGDCNKLTKYFPDLEFQGARSTLSWMLNDIPLN